MRDVIRMEYNFKNLLKWNIKNVAIIIYCFLLSFIISYVVVLNLLLGDNSLVRSIHKPTLFVCLFVCLFVSYVLYITYLKIIKKISYESNLDFLYGPIISSIFGFIFIIFLYKISSMHMASYLGSLAIETVKYYDLAWNINLTYIPLIFLIMLVTTIIVDSIYVLYKFRRNKVRLIFSVIISGIAFYVFILLAIGILFIAQIVTTTIIGGGGVA